MKNFVNRINILIGLLFLLMIGQLSADPSTFAMRMNGHKQTWKKTIWTGEFKSGMIFLQTALTLPL